MSLCSRLDLSLVYLHLLVLASIQLLWVQTCKQASFLPLLQIFSLCNNIYKRYDKCLKIRSRHYLPHCPTEFLIIHFLVSFNCPPKFGEKSAVNNSEFACLLIFPSEKKTKSIKPLVDYYPTL